MFDDFLGSCENHRFYVKLVKLLLEQILEKLGPLFLQHLVTLLMDFHRSKSLNAVNFAVAASN